MLYRAYFTIVQSQNKNASEKQHIVLWLASAPVSTEYEKCIVRSQGYNMHKNEKLKRSQKKNSVQQRENKQSEQNKNSIKQQQENNSEQTLLLQFVSQIFSINL